MAREEKAVILASLGLLPAPGQDPPRPLWPPCSPQLVLPSKAMSSCPSLLGGGEDTVPPDIPLETPRDRQCPGKSPGGHPWGGGGQ